MFDKNDRMVVRLGALASLAATVQFACAGETVTWNNNAWPTGYQDAYMKADFWNPNGTPVAGNDYVFGAGTFFTVGAGKNASWYTFNAHSFTWTGGRFVILGPKLDLTGVETGLVIQPPNPATELEISDNYATYTSALPITEFLGPISIGAPIKIILQRTDQQLTFKSPLSSIGETSPLLRVFCPAKAGVATTNNFVAFAGDLAAFNGNFRVDDDGAPVTVKFGSAAVVKGTLTLNAGRNGAVQALSPTDDMSVSTLVLSADSVVKADLDIDASKSGCIKVADVLTMTAPIHVEVKPVQDPGARFSPACRFAILTAPEGAELQKEDFTLSVVGCPAGRETLFSLVVDDNADGRSTLYVEKAAIFNPDQEVVNATWTGGDATDNLISRPGNWKEGLPSFATGQTLATFAESGSEAVVDGTPVFNGLRFTSGGFALSAANADAKATVLMQGVGVSDGIAATLGVPLEVYGNQDWTLGTGASLSLTAPLLDGVMGGYALTVTGGALNINASGATHTGKFTMKDCAVTVAGNEPFGLGSETVYFRGATTLSFGDLTTSRKIDFGTSGMTLTVLAGKTAQFNEEFFANVGTFRPAFQSGSKLVFNGAVRMPGWMVPTGGGNGQFEFHGPLTANTLQTDVPMTFCATGNKLSGNLGFCMLYSGGSVLRFGIDEATDSTVNLSMVGTGNCVDLCGYSQTFGVLTMMEKTPKVGQANTSKIMNSGKAATLHLAPSRELVSDGYPNAQIGGDITGPISLWKDGTARLVVTNKISAVGEIKVTSGKLEFLPGSSWLNATNLTVAGATASLKLAEAKTFNKKMAMAFADGGTIEIPAGVQVRALSATVDEQPLAMGVWKHGESYDASKQETPAIAGDGSLFVGPSGLLMIVR